METAESLALLGLIVAAVGLVAAIGFGSWHLRELWKFKGQSDEGFDNAYKLLQTSTTSIHGAIARSVEAIQLDGHQTTESIRDAHRDIKCELIEQAPKGGNR